MQLSNIMQNKILTTLNQLLAVEFYSLADPTGAPVLYSTLDGLPLGTDTNASDGELGVKVIVIADRSGAGGTEGAISIPPSDKVVYAYFGATNNIETATYSLLGVTTVVLTFVYAGGGAADNDKLISITKS